MTNRKTDKEQPIIISPDLLIPPSLEQTSHCTTHLYNPTWTWNISPDGCAHSRKRSGVRSRTAVLRSMSRSFLRLCNGRRGTTSFCMARGGCRLSDGEYAEDDEIRGACWTDPDRSIAKPMWRSRREKDESPKTGLKLVRRVMPQPSQWHFGVGPRFQLTLFFAVRRSDVGIKSRAWELPDSISVRGRHKPRLSLPGRGPGSWRTGI